jgi:PTH1 family peptidyl-tRNA hydrolase
MYLLIGLGNPGKEYEKTRHNIGFMVIDELVSRYSLSIPKVKFHGQISEGVIDGHKIMTAKPSTYMNRSGLCVTEIVKFYKIELDKIIVFHDEIDLLFCKVRVKTGGGNGGHNGLKDIDSHIGKDYKRVRIGVGHPGDRKQVSNYVLSNFAKAEEPALDKLISDISANVSHLLKADDNLFMTRISDSNSLK